MFFCMSLIFPFYGGGGGASLHFYISKRNDLHSQYYPMCLCIGQYHQLSGLRFWSVFRRRYVVMEIDVRWVSRGRRDVVYYHKWMTSHNFFDVGVTCSTFISIYPNIRNTGLYFHLGFYFVKLRKNEENVFSQGPK
jgi:hypothetical protein